MTFDQREVQIPITEIVFSKYVQQFTIFSRTPRVIMIIS
jgi:hypothetical protein